MTLSVNGLYWRAYWFIRSIPKRLFPCDACKGDGREMVYQGYGSCADIDCSMCGGKGWQLKVLTSGGPS
jgi:hypothetical protein